MKRNFVLQIRIICVFIFLFVSIDEIKSLTGIKYDRDPRYFSYSSDLVCNSVVNNDSTSNHLAHSKEICNFYFDQPNWSTFCLDGNLVYKEKRSYSYTGTIKNNGLACALNDSFYSIKADSWIYKFEETKDYWIFIGNDRAGSKPWNNYILIQQAIWRKQNSVTTAKCTNNPPAKTAYKVNGDWTTTEPMLNITDESITMTYNSKNGRYEAYIPYTSSGTGKNGTNGRVSVEGLTCSVESSKNRLYCYTFSPSKSNYIVSFSIEYDKKIISLQPVIDVFEGPNNCGGKRCQPVGRVGYFGDITSSMVTKSDSIKLIIPKNTDNLFEIKKTDSKGNLMPGAKFTIYYDHDCITNNSKVTTNGEKNYSLNSSFFSGLKAYFEGYYSKKLPFSVKEVVAPTGYGIDNTCYNFYYDIDTNQVKKTSDDNYVKSYTLTVVNKKDCESEYQALIDSGNVNPKTRIDLYTRNLGATNLLNFGEYANDAKKACEAATCSKKLNQGCLTASTNSNFSSNNLSCYDFPKTDSNGNPLFCAITFNLTNNLSTSWANPSKVVFAGQPILPFTDNGKIATLNLTIKCYGYGTENNIELKTYDEYIDGISFGGNKLIPDGGNSDLLTLVNQSGANEYKEYSTNIIKNYSFKEQYVQILNGKLHKDLNTFSFFGPISNFNDKTGNNNLKFSMNFGSELSEYSDITDATDNSCKYTIKNQIVEDGELNLEFRVIDATITDDSEASAKRLFPGILGNGRKIGSNWCIEGISACASNDKTLIDNIDMSTIINTPNSYGKIPSTGETKTAKYVIELDSATINHIRNYNDFHAYDEIDLEYNEESGEYESTFLKNKEIWDEIQNNDIGIVLK